jgi:hypothetical protein
LRDRFDVATGSAVGKSTVTARISLLYDVLNALIVKAALHSYFVSEEDVLHGCLSDQDLSDSLLLFDRGYPSFRLMYLLSQRGVKFVMRVQHNASNTVKQFLMSDATDPSLSGIHLANP